MVSKKKQPRRRKYGPALPPGAWLDKKAPPLAQRCEETGKAIFLSEGAARKSLVGQLSAKHVRIYRCDVHPSHFHLTKTYNNRLD